MTDKPNIFVKGIGMTKFGSINKPSYVYAYDAIAKALENAEMSPKDIDAIFVANMDFSTNGERQRHFASMFSSMLKFNGPIIRTPSACASGGAALWTAIQSNFDNVLVVGSEKITSMATPVMTEEFMQAAEYVWEQPEGLIFPSQSALVAQQHFLKYGSNSHDLALISLKNQDEL